MREIKVRAWHAETKRMHYNFQHFIVNVLIGQPLTATIYWWDGCLLSNCELLEFTGLLDKNGVEIYESDIVNVVDPRHLKPIRVIVKWSEQGLNWTIWQPAYPKYLEVIGNIFQHPKLKE